jgi:hypothetical protein
MKRLLSLLLGIQAVTLSLTAHTFLQVICEPGLEIFLDGMPVGTSNWKDSGFHTAISPGKYTTKATRRGETLSYDLEVPAGGEAELIFDFRHDRAHLYV